VLICASALISQQAGQDFFSDQLFGGIENTVRAALGNAS
jgi:hypothetical protein